MGVRGPVRSRKLTMLPSLPMLALPVSPPTMQAVPLLRSEKYAEKKNAMMMRRLLQEEWFVKYRHALHKYRHNNGPRPEYPATRVEEVEQEIDNWIRQNVNPHYTR